MYSKLSIAGPNYEAEINWSQVVPNHMKDGNVICMSNMNGWKELDIAWHFPCCILSPFYISASPLQNKKDNHLWRVLLIFFQ